MTLHDHTPAHELLAEELTLQLDHVDEQTCHQIGSQIAERGLREKRTVMVAVYLGDWQVYKCALPGTSLSNDIVIDSKRRVASIEGHSSLYARNHYLDEGTTFEEATGLALPGWAPFVGAVPLITLDGARQGWVIVSGLSQEEDHAFAVDGILAAQAAQGTPSGTHVGTTRSA